jgi:hypothetical protein
VNKDLGKGYLILMTSIGETVLPNSDNKVGFVSVVNRFRVTTELNLKCKYNMKNIFASQTVFVVYNFFMRSVIILSWLSLNDRRRLVAG